MVAKMEATTALFRALFGKAICGKLQWGGPGEDYNWRTEEGRWNPIDPIEIDIVIGAEDGLKYSEEYKVYEKTW